MKKFRWGIFGTGAISAKFISGLQSARNAEAVFVASRSPSRAQSFAAAMKVPRAIAGYAEAVEYDGVDAIYIATPPSELATNALLCIEAGIPVLVEKPFALNADEAKRVIETARSRSVFAMEAMWTRFLPAAQAMRERVRSGQLGAARVVSGNFGTSQVPDSANAMFNPALGGGALAYLGAYPLSLGQWLFGSPVLVQASGRFGQTGVDEDVAFQLQYPDQIIGSFFVSSRSWGSDDFAVSCTGGLVSLQGSIVRPTGLSLSEHPPIAREEAQFGWRGRVRQHAFVHKVAQQIGRTSRSHPKGLKYPYVGNGYHYEADEVRACLERGDLESKVMPLNDTLAVALTADTIRRTITTQADTTRSQH